jgi:hypothetical protein
MTTENEQVTIAMAAAVQGKGAHLIVTSVACALRSNVNTSRAQLIFPSKLDFCNLFKFPATKSTQKSNFFAPALKIVK